jgi:glycosyltransferase involved in cell wall biosynthesis
MKILFFASYPTLAIGYSRIANVLTNYLAEQGHDIYYVGISNFEKSPIPRHIHPNIHLIDALVEEQKNGSNELYGVNVICDYVISVKPDIVFIYNDIIVISRILNNFKDRKVPKTFGLYIYLDLVYSYEKIKLVKHVDSYADLIIVFSDYWKDNLIEMNINPDKIKILPHGFDSDKFFYVEKSEARKSFNINPEDFVILNTNRNSYRKNIDKTIDAFIQFLKVKGLDKNIKLFLNMDTNENNSNNSYNIHNQLEVACIKYRLDYNYVSDNHIFINGSNKSYSDEMLNYLYNACDVGINTCIGEGFGLCNLEHGGIGKPQIVSGVGALRDIFSDDYATIIEPVGEYYIPNSVDYHGGYGKICSTDDFTNAMIKYYDNRDLVKSHGEKALRIITTKYNWNTILSYLNDIINGYGYGYFSVDKNSSNMNMNTDIDMNNLELFKVYNFDKKCRNGTNGDGGYVIGELDGGYDCYISAGISNEESFSRDFIDKYNMNETNCFGFDGTIDSYPYQYTDKVLFFKKNINSYNDDYNSDLSFLLDKYNNIFLKMDIEGGEYPWLLSIDESKLNNIKQIVIEFHGVTNNGWGCNYDDKIKCLEKLSKTHYIIHAHGNNYGPTLNKIPDVIELTYVNKSYFTSVPELNTQPLPIANLDFPNTYNSSDIDLNFYPFVTPVK